MTTKQANGLNGLSEYCYPAKRQASGSGCAGMFLALCAIVLVVAIVVVVVVH